MTEFSPYAFRRADNECPPELAQASGVRHLRNNFMHSAGVNSALQSSVELVSFVVGKAVLAAGIVF